MRDQLKLLRALDLLRSYLIEHDVAVEVEQDGDLCSCPKCRATRRLLAAK